MKKADNKGMMTLEAVIIVPFILVATILIFWGGILWYDRSVAEYAVAAAVIRGASEAEEGNEKIAETVREKINDILSERLLLAENVEISVSVSYGKIEAGMHGELYVPALPFYGDAIWEITAEEEAARLRRSQIVRTIHRIDRELERREEERNGENVDGEESEDAGGDGGGEGRSSENGGGRTG